MNALTELERPERAPPASAYPILVVDDEEANVIVFEALFRDQFTILTASSAERALEILEKHDVAVMMTDHRMPDISGVDLCQRVRERYPHVRRMLVTAYSDQQTAVDAINRGGVHAYLIKPWNAEQVRQMLVESVSRVHLERLVSSLRAAIVQKERELSMAAMRDRILHDLGGVTMVLSISCKRVDSFLSEHRGLLPPDEIAKVQRDLESLKKSVQHIVALHGERRALAGSQRPRIEPLDVKEVLQSVESLVGAGLGTARLHLHCADGMTLKADRIAVTRILVNLIQNAREALEASEAMEGQIHVDVARDGNMVTLEVGDSGNGVPAEFRNKIFNERFTTRAKEGGTGMGLPASRDLAMANGGTLELMPRGRLSGAAFRLSLPAASEP